MTATLFIFGHSFGRYLFNRTLGIGCTNDDWRLLCQRFFKQENSLGHNRQYPGCFGRHVVFFFRKRRKSAAPLYGVGWILLVNLLCLLPPGNHQVHLMFSILLSRNSTEARLQLIIYVDSVRYSKYQDI